MADVLQTHTQNINTMNTTDAHTTTPSSSSSSLKTNGSTSTTKKKRKRSSSSNENEMNSTQTRSPKKKVKKQEPQQQQQSQEQLLLQEDGRQFQQNVLYFMQDYICNGLDNLEKAATARISKQHKKRAEKDQIQELISSGVDNLLNSLKNAMEKNQAKFKAYLDRFVFKVPSNVVMNQVTSSSLSLSPCFTVVVVCLSFITTLTVCFEHTVATWEAQV